MDRRERVGDQTTTILAALEGAQAAMWTAMPAIITKYDATKGTVECRVAIKVNITDEKGAVTPTEIPLLVDCPVLFPSGGGFTLTFPIAPGDEALVVFASRCIDAWWDSGAVSVQSEFRMHDLSDGFAMVGPRSRPRVISPAPSTAAVELRNDDQSSFVRIKDDGDVEAVSGTSSVSVSNTGFVTVNADHISLNATTITITGSLIVDGNVDTTGTLKNNTKNVGSTHAHSGVFPGGSNTGAPV